MRRYLLLRAPAALALLVAGLAVAVIVLRPLGAPTAAAAGRDQIRERATASVPPRALLQRPWGRGVLVLTGYDGRRGARHLVLAFVTEGSRGWRVAAATDERAELSDVVLGSLLFTSSDGGRGQPAWTAVYGETGEGRVARIETRWADGAVSATDVTRRAYLDVRRGMHQPSEVRFLAADGSEIARVPIG